MNVRKSSLPVSAEEKSLLPKDNSPLKHLWHGAKKRLVASCSKINIFQESTKLSSNKIHSFPGSTNVFDTICTSSVPSSKSNSSASISDTMLKVRRLTHVYDEEEFITQCDVTSMLCAASLHQDNIDKDEEYISILEIKKEIPKPSAKLGDRSYKLPSKAAAILGADDSLVHQLLHENNSSANSHALFLENKLQKSYHSDTGEFVDSSNKVQKTKKKSGLGTEVKEKIASLWKQSDIVGMPGSTGSSYSSTAVQYGTAPGTVSGLQLKDMEKLLRAGKATLEQITNWSHSFESLLHDKFGLAHFHDFLRSEFSDENIEFWIACEEYRTITNNKKLQSRAEKIYNDYVGVQAAREVNLDSKTRQQTEIDIHNPSPHTFDQAQKRIQALMEKDSYQRFLRSELYGSLVRASEEYHQSQLKSIKDSVTPNKGLTICNLGITAQDLSKLTMTTSKLALLPHPNINLNKTCPREPQKVLVPARESSLVSTVQPDEPSLPFSKQSLIFSPEDKQK